MEDLREGRLQSGLVLVSFSSLARNVDRCLVSLFPPLASYSEADLIRGQAHVDRNLGVNYSDSTWGAYSLDIWTHFNQSRLLSLVIVTTAYTDRESNNDLGICFFKMAEPGKSERLTNAWRW